MEKIVNPCEGCFEDKPDGNCFPMGVLYKPCGNYHSKKVYQARLDQQARDWREFVKWLRNNKWDDSFRRVANHLEYELQQQLGGINSEGKEGVIT